MNNSIDQFNEAFSRWSILDKVGKSLHMMEMWQQATNMYHALMGSCAARGYITETEMQYAGQLQQVLRDIESSARQLDADLYNEMVQHLAKMVGKGR